MIKKKSSHHSSHIFGILFVSITAWIVVVVLSTVIGDAFLKQDRFTQASDFYRIAKVLNPFNPKITQRIAIVDVITEERKGESEETQFLTEDGSNNTIATSTHQAVLGASTVTVPILMYHYIRVNPYPSDIVGFNLSVTPNNFATQMDYLVNHGYHAITLDEFGKALLHATPLPAKPIVITLDDGYRDSYTDAFPILKARGLKAVNFVITGFVGGPIYLTWDYIQEMQKSGVFTFESHTVHHLALTYLASQKILEELTESKHDLETHVGGTINWIAYPYGNVNDAVAQEVPKAGYAGAFGTNLGDFHSTDHLYTLARIRIGGGDSVSSFAAKLPWK